MDELEKEENKDLNKEQEESKPLEMNSSEGKQEAEENISVEKEKSEEKLNLVPENKEGKIRSFLKGKNKKPSWKPFIFVMIASLAIAFFWDSIPAIKDSVHSILDPSVGALLQLNISYGMEIGMLVITLIIAVFTSLVQKYCTDQETIKELRKEQKILQTKANEFKHHPEKMMEIQKEIMPLTMKTMQLSMRGVMFTGIPFILFFRWFNDFFAAMGDPKFFGVLSWFWFYLIAVMVFSGVLRKLLKVV